MKDFNENQENEILENQTEGLDEDVTAAAKEEENKAESEGNLLEESENGAPIEESEEDKDVPDQEEDYEEETGEEVKEEKISLLSQIKASFQTRKFRGGAYATAISVIVIIMVLVVNVIVTKLDLKVDITTESFYTLTDTTKDYVKDLQDDITIYYLVQSGNENSTFTGIVDKYKDLSDHIKVVYKDPVLYPNFAKDYTDSDVTDNSIVVVNDTNERAKYIDYNDMLQTEVDYSTYQTSVTGIDVEGQITSAIQYVTTEDLPVLYEVEGHGEAAMSDTLSTNLEKANVTTNTLATLTVEAIPDDCSILFIDAPQTDYTEDEVSMIKDYLANGGDAIILVDYAAEGLTNFNELLSYYGLGLVQGVVVEGKQGNYMGQYPSYLIPNLESHDITSDLISDNTSIVAPSAVGINVLDSARSTETIEPILTTSDESYSKVNVNSDTISKEDGDIDGPFNIGVAVTETYNDAETKMVVLGSAYIIDESMLAYNSIGNLDLIVNSVNFISGQEDNSLAVPTRSVTQEYLSMSAAQVNFWAIFIVIIIPAVVLGIGGYVCIRRRKR